MDVQKSIMGLALLSIAPFVVFTPSVAEQSVSATSFGEGYMCGSDLECEEATGYPYDVALSNSILGKPFERYPRLVGHGCEGARGPIYAFEEDHLPKCREIAPMNWYWKEKML